MLEAILSWRLDFVTFAVLVVATGVAGRLVAYRFGVAGPTSWPRIALAAGVVLAGILAAQANGRRTQAEVRKAGMMFAATCASDLEQIGHAEISCQTPVTDSRYVSLVTVARTWLQHNRLLSDLYTFRRTPTGEDRRILNPDSTAPANGERYVPCQTESESNPQYAWEQLLKGEPVFDVRRTRGAGGTSVRVLQPMRDRVGRVDAVLVVGISDEQWTLAAFGARLAVLAAVWAAYAAVLGAVYVARYKARVGAQERAAAILQERETYFRSLFDHLPDIAVQGYDPERRVIYWNDASARLYGYAREEALGRKLEDLIIPPPMRSGVVAAVEQWVTRGIAIPAAELVLQRKDGAPVSVFSSHVMQVNMRGEKEMYCVDIDLADRNRAQQALAVSEGNYRTLFEVIPHPMCVYDVETLRFCAVNGAAVAHYGYSREEFLTMPIDRIVVSESVDRLRQTVSHLQDSGPSFTSEWRHVKKNGEVIIVDMISHPLQWAGRPARIVLAQDVTARREAERRIREQAELLDKITEAVVVVDSNDRITYWNPGAERLFGHAAAEMLGLCLQAAIAAVPALEPVAQAFINHPTNWRGEVEAMNTGGRRIVLETSVAVIRDDGGRVVGRLSVSSDISQRKTLEAQVIEAQKMEVVGQLAGGVAHDFNSILMAMALNLEMVEADVGAASPVKPMLEELKLMNARATRLVGQLLLFARRHAMRAQPLEVNVAVAGVTKLLRRLLGADIELRVDLAGEVVWVRADPGMFDQVVLNLAVNARDAMPKGGDLGIRVGKVRLDAEAAAAHPNARPGTFATLQVSDTGCGMGADVLAHAFEPFFTTKPAGKGTGLGLATVHGIAQQHGGWVAVDSVVDKGTTFTVYLPLIAAPEAAERDEPVEGARGGSETILLVEDDDSVRRIMAAMLLRLGYRVLLSARAEQAIDVFDKQERPIDVLLTDVVLPGGINGFDVAERLRARQPALRVIIMSGYNVEMIKADEAEESGFMFLQKPVNSAALAAAIRKALE